MCLLYNPIDVDIPIGTLSGKIYDDTSFFSKNMLFGRFTDESKIATLLTPAYEEYIDAYITLINNTPPDYSEEKQTYVKSRQVGTVLLRELS